MGVKQDVYVTIPRGRYKDLDASMAIDTQIEAPIAEGQELGQINIKLDGKPLLSEAVIATHAVNEGGLIQKALDRVKLMFQQSDEADESNE